LRTDRVVVRSSSTVKFRAGSAVMSRDYNRARRKPEKLPSSLLGSF